MAKFLSDTGLQTVWSKIDSLFLRKTSVDTVPTSGSSNPISSGGMYSVLEELEDVVAASENSLNNRLTTIEGMNLVTGTGLTADKIVLGNGNSTVKTSSKGITTTAPSSSSTDNDIPTSAAVNSAISSALGTVAGALKYKGTVASNSALPANHSVGDVYVVSTAGTFVGKACEVGDYIVCNTSGTAANNAHWDVLNGENQVSNASASLAAAGQSATIATVDGTNITVTTPSTWTGLAKTGTVTSVGMTVPTGLSVSGSPVTGSGTLAVSFASGYSIPTTAKQGNWDTAYGWGNHASAGYVKLDPGANEQTIKSSISSMSKGVVNLWRSSGDHYTFLGFSNGTTETALGGIGFKSQADHNLYRKDGSNYYKILDENNYTTYVNTTNFPGLNKTGTVTSVTLSSGTGITVSDSGTAITTTGSRTISLATVSGLSAGTYKSVTVDTYGRVTAGTNPTTLAGYGITDAASSGHNHDTVYRNLIDKYYGSTAQSANTITFSNSLLNTDTPTTAWWHIDTKFYSSTATSGAKFQIAGSYNASEPAMYIRQYYNSTWTNWRQVLTAANYNSSTYADTTPTQNSTKLITSGGIYSALDEIESVVAASEDALNTRVTTLENNTITGSGLTADKIVLGNGTRTVKTSSKGITTTAPSSSSDDTTIPTSKAVNSAIASHAGVDKTGTVTSVTLTSGTGITVSDSGTAITGSGSRTISLASVSGLTAGTYTSVTVDTYGRVTAGTNPTTQTIKQDGITGATINRYGTCSTGASTVAKTVSVTGGTPTLETGLKVTVYFSAKNTANSPTLNVNSLGAKRIYHNGDLIGSGTNKGMLYGAVDLVYNSTLNSSAGAWQIVGNYVDTNTHNSHALTVTNGTASSTTGTITYVESVTGCSATNGDLTATTTRKSISVLSSHQTIKQDGITGATVNRYGTCSTAAGTAAKTVSVGAGTPTLETGLKVTVYFSAKNTANSPTLNVNSLGAKSIYHNGAVIGSGTNKGMLYGAVDFVYNSTLNSNAGGWQLIGNYVDTTGTNVTDATVQGWGYTKGIKFKIPGGGAYNSTTQVLTPVTMTAGRYLKDTSWTDITFSPSSGTNTINAVPIYRQDATWGDWVFYWEGVDDQHVSNGSKGGLLWKNGEFVMAGNFHCTGSLAFYQSGTYVPGSINTGTIGASFYANNNGGGDANSSAFFINVSSAAGGWNGHETFRFDKDGIYAYPVNGRTGITGWFINESDALTNSEIDTILANAT